MEIVLICLIALIGAIMLYFFKNSSVMTKAPAVKKSEVEQNYINKMQNLIDENKENKDKLLIEKTKLLKEINSELSRNIFFTPEESKKLIQKLLNL
jgi:hypothetical protein